MTCVWHKGPTGKWEVYGPHAELTAAKDTESTVEVKARNGDRTLVPIIHVSRPNREGYAYGHMPGTFAEEFKTTKLPTVQPQDRTQRMRNRSAQRATRRKRSRAT